MIKNIPLNKLVPSPHNVRRSSDAQADAELTADIEARGLLQNLVVSAVSKPRGSFSVEAGSRRLRALQQLLSEGKLAKDHEVCCLVIDDRGSASEASLAENFQRLSMNPADECLAFQGLIGQGSSSEDIARRFGLTVRFVEGRLRLAALAPLVFEALGAGEISLDLAKAYAATPDQDRQTCVFEQMGRGYGTPHPDSVRRMMTQATVVASDRRALFVGEDAYVAAGGRVERDLFSDSNDARWLDVGLLERLARERLDRVAAEMQVETGFAFVRATLDRWLDPSLLEGLRRVTLAVPPLSDEAAAQVDALETEADDLVALLDDEESSPEARQHAEDRIRELGLQIDALVDPAPEIDDELKPQVGAFLMLDDFGQPKLDRSLFMDGAQGSEAATEQSAGGRCGSSSLDRPAKSSGLSQRLLDELAMQRRDILSVHLAADPRLSLDLVIFLMAGPDAGYLFEKSGSSLRSSPPPNPAAGFKTPDAPATLAAAAAAEGLDRSWTERDSLAERFDAFRSLPENARLAWLGRGIARTLEASLNQPGPRACAFHDHLGHLLGVDVARWWRPTGANFFDRVPKALALGALSAVGGPELSARYAKAKKAELAEACERIFAGDLLAEPAVKESACTWLPEIMRFAEIPAVDGSNEPADGSEDEDQADDHRDADNGFEAEAAVAACEDVF